MYKGAQTDTKLVVIAFYIFNLRGVLAPPSSSPDLDFSLK